MAVPRAKCQSTLNLGMMMRMLSIHAGQAQQSKTHRPTASSSSCPAGRWH
jgi:hypothetical protein